MMKVVRLKRASSPLRPAADKLGSRNGGWRNVPIRNIRRQLDPKPGRGHWMMAKPTWYNNDRRIDQLERLYEAADNKRYQTIDQVGLAILEEYEEIIAGPDDKGPPRGPEVLELAVSRVLEKHGRTTAQIAEELDVWMEAFGEEPLGGKPY